MPTTQISRFAVVLIALTAGCLFSFSSVATAAPTTTLSACVSTKGKKKGLMRFVSPAKVCKSKTGQKKVSWSVVGPAGVPGAPGTADPSLIQIVQAQAAQITNLTEQLEQVTGVLDGVTNNELLSGLTNAAKLNGISNNDLLSGLTNAAKLDGISSGQLSDLLAGVPALDAVCTQLSAVTDQTNLLGGVIDNISVTGILSGLLNIPGLPPELDPFTCN